MIHVYMQIWMTLELSCTSLMHNHKEFSLYVITEEQIPVFIRLTVTKSVFTVQLVMGIG